MDNRELEDKVFDILENIKRVARNEYGMYLHYGDLIVDTTKYKGKMKVDCEDLVGKVLIGLDELYVDSIKENNKGKRTG